MTKAEKLRIYQSMEEKILRTLEKKSGEQLIGKEMEGALDLLDYLASAQLRMGMLESTEAPTVPAPEEADPAGAPKPVTEPAPASGPEAESDAGDGDGDGGETLAKEEVRAKLAALATNPKVNVAAIMAEMGYAKLSDVPAARYQELLDKANAAKEA